MRFILWCAVASVLAAVGCAASPNACSPQAAPPSTSSVGVFFGGGDGSSFETAVIIQGAKDETAGVAAEHRWLTQRFPGAWKDGQSLQTRAGKQYDVIEISTPKGERTIYFDVTELVGRLELNLAPNSQDSTTEAWRKIHHAEDVKSSTMNIEGSLLLTFADWHSAFARQVRARFIEPNETWEVTVVASAAWPSIKMEERQGVIESVKKALDGIVGHFGMGKAYVLVFTDDTERVIGGYPDDKGAVWWKE